MLVDIRDAFFEELYNKYPGDVETAVFYSLAVLATADLNDKSYIKQKKSGQILEKLFETNPNHPGIAHYIIHNYDSPELAHLALNTARKYAVIAPASAHAQHMPSHIFTRLGLWNESIKSNIDSANSAVCYAESVNPNANWVSEIHALDYLVYAYLQMGDNVRAQTEMNKMIEIKEVFPSDHFASAYALIAVPSRLAVENKDWELATELELPKTNLDWDKAPWPKAMLHFSRALGFTNTGNSTAAQKELDILIDLRERLNEAKNSYESGQVTIQIEAVRGWIEYSKGNSNKAIEYMKSRLVDSNADRLNKIETNETVVIGVNKFTTSEDSPLTTGDKGIMIVDPAVEAEQIGRLNAWRNQRDPEAVKVALDQLSDAAKNGANIMPASVNAAKVGATTGEWAEIMRSVYGEYRGPTGLSKSKSNKTEGLDEIRSSVDIVSDKLGRRLKFLMGKPGLDGHSNGAEQFAFRGRDCGMEIEYQGIRLTPEQLVDAVLETHPHVIGLSILSGSHIPLVKETLERLSEANLSHIPLVVGGIIPDEDAISLGAMGVSKVYTPKDFELNSIMMDIVELADPRKVAAE